MNDEFGMLMFGFAISAVIAYTSEAVVYPQSFEHGNKLCEQNGGLKYLVEPELGSSKAVCKNGAKFTYDWEELRKVK
jgi:hypothetical protein